MAARFRISGPARADLSTILATSLERWGEYGRARYAALLVTAMKSVARDPERPTTRGRSELLPGIRSFHLKHARREHGVDAPVHVLFFRITGSVIEIVRVLHERMEPTAHLVTVRRKPRVPRRPRK
jgi:toxin ParE1/3/4